MKSRCYSWRLPFWFLAFASLTLAFASFSPFGVGLAQTEMRPPEPVRPVPEIKAQPEFSQENWRRLMTQTPLPKSGCFTSSYPSMQWREVPCIAAPPRPHPAHGPRPLIVGAGTDVVATPVAPISLAAGSFDSVVGVVSETDSGFGTPNTFSLQINTNNDFVTPMCAGAKPNPNHLLSPGVCKGWQQFVFSNAPCGPGLTCASAFIQYWLINYGPTCPATGGAISGWMTTPLAADDCFANSNAVPVPPQTIAGLANFDLTGTTSSGSDAVFMSVGNPAILSAMGGPGSVLGLAGQWTQAEFNIFGESNASQANFNLGSAAVATVVVRTSVNGALPITPACASFTGETNNLSLAAPPAAAAAGPFPAIVFTESTAGAAACAPAPPPALPVAAAPAPPPTIPVFRCIQATSNLIGAYGIGILTAHPEFCSLSGPIIAPASVPAYVATPITTLPPAAGLSVFVCNQFSPDLSASYGIGELTTHPQFCWNGGPGGQTVPPSPVPPSVATDTGLTAGTLPIFRCNHARPSAPYGIGVLTTHPQFCALNGPTSAPGVASSSVAADAGVPWHVE